MVIEARLRLGVGPERLAYETGVPARTATRILRRWGMPYLRDRDPTTGEVVRASKSGRKPATKPSPTGSTTTTTTDPTQASEDNHQTVTNLLAGYI